MPVQLPVCIIRLIVETKPDSLQFPWQAQLTNCSLQATLKPSQGNNAQALTEGRSATVVKV